MAYTTPTAEDVRARFPGKFEDPGVTDLQIAYALGRATRAVDSSWTEGDYQEGLMLYAASFLTTQGLGVMPAGAAEGLAGIRSVRSGALSIEFAGAQSAAQMDPALNTVYGRQFAALRVVNRGGARVTSPGTFDVDLYPGCP